MLLYGNSRCFLDINAVCTFLRCQPRERANHSGSFGTQVRDIDRDTSLHWVTKKVGMVRLLLGHGADPDIPNKDRDTPPLFQHG